VKTCVLTRYTLKKCNRTDENTHEVMPIKKKQKRSNEKQKRSNEEERKETSKEKLGFIQKYRNINTTCFAAENEEEFDFSPSATVKLAQRALGLDVNVNYLTFRSNWPFRLIEGIISSIINCLYS